MRRIHVLVAILAVVVVGLTGIASVGAAGSFRSGTDIAVASGEVVDQTLFTAGRTIDIAGTVNGDVFCAGQSITVSGTVNGDVLCAGQSLTVTGTVNGNVRLAGQSVSVDGHVTRNASVVAQTFTLESAGKVDGDVSLGGQTATLNGSVGRDVLAGGTAVLVNGSVARDVTVGTTSLTLGSQSIVQGNISYTSEQALSRDSGAQVMGTITRHQPEKRMAHEGQNSAANGIWLALYFLLALLLIALAMVLVVPGFLHAATEAAVAAPFKALGIGVLVSILAPVIIFGLFFTVIGIPLAAILLLGWLLVCAVAWTFAAYYLGSMLLSKSTNNRIWYMLAGAAIILVVGLIPFVGFLVWLVAFWLGLGTIALQLPRLSRPKYVEA